MVRSAAAPGEPLAGRRLPSSSARCSGSSTGSTRSGIATRAAAGNEKGAILLGYSPDRLALANWVLSAVLAGMAGILVSPVTGLDPVRFTLFIVPALGAALLGNLTSIPVAVAAGLLLGVAAEHRPELGDGGLVPGVGPHRRRRWRCRSSSSSWCCSSAATRSRPRLGDRATACRARPTRERIWQHALIWPAVVFLLSTGVSIGGVTLVPQLTGTWQLGLTTSLILAILALSATSCSTGYMGQISLAQLALAGTAAFVTVRLMSDGKCRGRCRRSPWTGPGFR